MVVREWVLVEYEWKLVEVKKWWMREEYQMGVEERSSWRWRVLPWYQVQVEYW